MVVFINRTHIMMHNNQTMSNVCFYAFAQMKKILSNWVFDAYFFLCPHWWHKKLLNAAIKYFPILIYRIFFCPCDIFCVWRALYRYLTNKPLSVKAIRKSFRNSTRGYRSKGSIEFILTCASLNIFVLFLNIN